jgi:protoporphyrinogen oxidase
MTTDTHVETLIVGAGVSGLATAAFLRGRSLQVLEAGPEIGGYCKTVRQDGFVWDYSGHFFHFKHPDIEAYLRERMRGQNVRTVEKRAYISYAGRHIDFPFQKNIHQLPLPEFLECLHDLYFASASAPQGKTESFRDMLYARLGKAICEKFLVPYNEKLYATDLGSLDPDAMGRFFPHTTFEEVLRHFKTPDAASYNQTFTYPEGGAIEYVKALASEVPANALALNEPLTGVDLAAKMAVTPRRRIRYDRLVSTAPFPSLLKLSGVAHDEGAFSWNQVLVFNLGFDRKGPTAPHWIYFPDRAISFYRVGFYDNIFDTDRMSLYVELGFPKDARPDVAALRAKVLEDLARVGIVQGHKLISHHSVAMNPAYVHISQRSMAEHERLSATLAAHGVHSIGRYGGWTYCSIEDNIVEARALARSFLGG